MTPGAIQKGQRLIVVVFAPPSPVITQQDNKGETAAKIVPGLGLLVKDAQDQTNLKISQDLQQYLPRWQAAQSFYPLFLEKFVALGQPGIVVEPKDAGIPEQAWHNFNRAKDTLDWQLRYFVRQVDGSVSRNYSNFLQLDDALVLEVNLGYGLESDGEDNFWPSLRSVTKLFRVNNMHELWRHDDFIEDKSVTKTLYEFKLQPGDVVYAWQRMLPDLAGLITGNIAKNLEIAGVKLSPGGAPAPDSAPVPAPDAAPVPAPAPETVPQLPPHLPVPSTP